MRRDSLIAMLGDFVGLHNSPAYKPSTEAELAPPEQIKKKQRASSMYCGDIPPTHLDVCQKTTSSSSSSSSRRQSEPALKHSSRQQKTRKTSSSSQRSASTIASNPISESSESSISSTMSEGKKGSRRGSETLLGSIAIFSKPLIVINGRM